jgi:Putative beta-lactamase-inhibitor-like, PepSY-like
MKKLLFIAVLAGFTVTSSTVNAQIRKVPARVTNAFKAKYPLAKNVEWRDKITSLQANFYMEGNKYEAKFNRNGHWKKTEVTVSEYNLPLAVREGMQKSKYRSWKVNSAYVLYSADGKTHYHIVADKNYLTKKVLVFNKRGQLLSDYTTI